MFNDQKYIPLGNYDVPSGWPMKPYKRPYGGTPGAPVMYEKPSDPEDESAGYGYTNAENIQEKDIYFYHSDHLGSTSYITDRDGNATQFVCYKPYGESLIDEHNTTFEQPWKFNGKELDSETGLYYYGARYYEPVLAIFYGTDRYTEKFPWQSAYSYAGGNPIGNIDINGDSIVVNGTGKILYNDNKDGNVYLCKNGKAKYIGELGKTIDINDIYSQLLQNNADEAKEIWWPFTFRDKVKTNGDWDLKNNKEYIYGLANDGKTKLSFNGKEMESQDIGNHHFGVVTEAYGLFPEEFALKQAGRYQIKSGTSKKEWQRYSIRYMPKPDGPSIIKEPLPPYGDDPRDQYWIRSGFQYYKQHVKK